eukprot:gnl/MRDRNA2_/MRDRNA2_80724_c0_seq2.p1 gnl/MRDRNA2_/MRDRNA2_80724_c0~~gnl/MRDRNA2_/MRDRNA2_80724_c0_seq2.p1  ORF type:complete len:411 (-),score=61.90 gnl/MRDRNA2_/MRDRNA2_80724_c0_seq2:213-1397(-)
MIHPSTSLPDCNYFYTSCPGRRALDPLGSPPKSPLGSSQVPNLPRAPLVDSLACSTNSEVSDPIREPSLPKISKPPRAPMMGTPITSADSKVSLVTRGLSDKHANRFESRICSIDSTVSTAASEADLLKLPCEEGSLSVLDNPQETECSDVSGSRPMSVMDFIDGCSLKDNAISSSRSSSRADGAFEDWSAVGNLIRLKQLGNLPETEGFPTSLVKQRRSARQERMSCDLEQFKEGTKSVKDIACYLASKNCDIRQQAVEAVGFASACATQESIKHVAQLLSDKVPCVRQAAMKSLCAVVAKCVDQRVSQSAQRALTKADSCTRYDAIEVLKSYAMKGSRRAYQAIEWYHSKDTDSFVRLRAEAEKSLIFAAGAQTNGPDGARMVVRNSLLNRW